MKKRILSIALVLCMVLAVLPTATIVQAATTETEGNIEYWHCEECGKYFSDKDGKAEIKLADTVIAKLVKTDSDNKSPQTGDNSRMALWFALLLVSGGGLLGTTAYRRKKKYSVLGTGTAQ